MDFTKRFCAYVIRRTVCRLLKICKTYNDNYPDSLFDAIKNENVDEVKKLISDHPETNLNQLLLFTVLNVRSVPLMEVLIKLGAKNLDECLSIASKNNSYNIVKVLISNGATTTVGIKNTNSNNILRMIYAYEEEIKQKNLTTINAKTI